MPKPRLITKYLLLPVFISSYLLSAYAGYWAAYDKNSAQQRLFLLVIGAGFVLIVGLLERRYRIKLATFIAIAVTFSAGGFALYYLVQRDFSHNVWGGIAGSVLALLLPLAVGTVGWAWGQRWRITAIILAAFALSCLVGLVATGERVAILALFGGSVVASLWAWVSSRTSANVQTVFRIAGWLIGVLSVIVLGTYLWFIVSPQSIDWLTRNAGLDRNSEAVDRLAHWQNVLALIADYPFTGAGLTSTEMVLASYVYVNHVPSQPNAHNLYLQVAAEQGWLGLLALSATLFVALMLATESMRSTTKELRWLRMATLASLVTLTTYGFLDGEIYAYRSVPLIFVPIALIQCLRTSYSLHRKVSRRVAPELVWGGIAMGVVLLGWVWFNGVQVRATLFANLGTVSQTKNELRNYEWPKSGIQDALRRDSAITIDPAIEQYEIALALDPQNEIALRRLGQIALSRGDIAVAEPMLTQALQVAPTRYATRLLLGELYAITGRTAESAELWQTIALLDGQIDGRLWWYAQLDDADRVERIQQVNQILRLQK